MKPTEAAHGSLAWTTWASSHVASEAADERPWLHRARLQVLRLLLALGAVALVFLAVRAAVLLGEFKLSDTANALFFCLLFLLSFVRPGWLTAITWLGLASIFINAVDGLDLHGDEAIGGVHVLLPLFILYAALLGDLYMSLTAMLGVLGIYAATWIVRGTLDYRDTVILTDLIVLTVVSGAAALGVWLRHSRLEKTLESQAKALRNELETRLRIQAMVTHDIRSPLTGLILAASLDDGETVQEMASRIAQVVDSTQRLTKSSGITLSTVSVAEIFDYTRETFAARLSAKYQTLSITGDPHLAVEADLPILCNSVLGNFLGNSIKYSPRGTTIRMVAEPMAEEVRIAVHDEGPGLPAEVIQSGPGAPRRHSVAGTQGESGTGYGLQIAALCAARMNGRIEIQDVTHGTGISVVLPRVSCI